MFEITNDIPKIKEEVKEFLTRIGETDLLNYLEKSDFYIAPASTIFHGNFEGGLLLHSYHVASSLARIALSFQIDSPVSGMDTVDFAYFLGLVHDLCKVNFYESYLKNVKDDATNTWSKVPAYKVKDDHKVYGHGLTSYLRMAKLVKNEQLVQQAIYPVVYHMGSYDVSEQASKGYSKAQNDFPWLTLLQAADQIAAFVYGY